MVRITNLLRNGDEVIMSKYSVWLPVYNFIAKCLNVKGLSDRGLSSKVIIFCCFAFLSTNEAVAAVSKNVLNWQEDINFYREALEQNHINLFHTLSKEHFYRDLESLKEQMPKLHDNEILVRLMEITRKVDDGHTSFPLWSSRLNKFPLKLTAIEEKLYVSETVSEHQFLLKGELISINDVSITDIKKRLSRLTPFSENPYSTSVRVAEYLPIAEVLHGIGIIEPNYIANFAFKVNGKKIDIALAAKTVQPFQKKTSFSYLSFKDNVASVNQSLWFTLSPDKSSVYIKFGRYSDLNTMDDFSSKLLRFINDNQSENLIIDLRNNYGGDFFVGLKMAQYLVLADSLNWNSGIYVLINNGTFSAAMSNAAQFRSLLNAMLIGEPTGAKPKGYQDMGQFTLPHSKQVVTYSKRFYDFMGDDKNAIYPDKEIKLTVEDFLHDRDAPLEWVLKQVGWQHNPHS